jgi:beta-glucosidase
VQEKEEEEVVMAQETRFTATQDSPADVRAREVEEQMTDDERFALVVSVVGENPVIPLARHERIPAGTPMSSGYTPGVPRLGIPALDERR